MEIDNCYFPHMFPTHTCTTTSRRVPGRLVNNQSMLLPLLFLFSTISVEDTEIYQTNPIGQGMVDWPKKSNTMPVSSTDV